VSEPRVVSLVPSVTETLLSWGVEPVAVTRFCEAPGIPAVGGTKNPDLEAILALAPDVVVMDREENRASDAEQLAAAGVGVLATHVTSVAGVDEALAALAAALGRRPPVRPVAVAGGADSTGPGAGTREAGRRLRVWVPIWRRPWMTVGAGTYGSSLLDRSGFENIYASAQDAYPLASPGEAAAAEPDWVLAPSEPYKFGERHRAELEVAGPIVYVDGQDLFWWGARTPAALVRLGNLAAELAARQDSAQLEGTRAERRLSWPDL
jgi:ABC-type Fe3+-hydroxamate transport system substrate-binding protein